MEVDLVFTFLSITFAYYLRMKAVVNKFSLDMVLTLRTNFYSTNDLALWSSFELKSVLICLYMALKHY